MQDLLAAWVMDKIQKGARDIELRVARTYSNAYGPGTCCAFGALQLATGHRRVTCRDYESGLMIGFEGWEALDDDNPIWCQGFELGQRVYRELVFDVENIP